MKKEEFDTLNDCYNMGVNDAIKFATYHRDTYKALNPRGNEVAVLTALITSLEHLKKPIQANDDLSILEESYKPE